MKLMCLNIWGGHIRDPLLKFIESLCDISVFCFQEVYHNAQHKISDEDRENTLNIFSELHQLLPDYNSFFTPVVGNSYGIGMFIKNDCEILHQESALIFENPNYSGSGPRHSRYLQWVEYCFEGQNYSIFNVHGLWNGQGKGDTNERIEQSRRIRNFVDRPMVTSPKILCGDFNLTPDTESISILEAGMTNLIRDHQVTSTRTSLYSKKEKFADYVFTCPKVTVNDFKVLDDPEVSDHKPLLVDFH